MFPVKESQACWNTSYLDHMALLQPERNYSLPFIPLSELTASNLPVSNTGQENAVDRFLKPVPPNCDISYPTENPHLRDSQNPLIHDLRVTDKPIGAPQKRFLIFDHSGNQTRLFFSPSFSTQNQIFASNPPTSANGPFGETAARVNPEFLTKPIIEEKWDENHHLTDGEGENELLEDSEEIDALFYSDSDYDEYDDNDDDEVTSPFTIEEGYNKDKLLEELIERVASSDDSPKRRKLLDGEYKKSSRAIISCGYEDDVLSSCAGDDDYSYDDDIDLGKREKKVKIRQALKILENIIPGLNSKDPLSVIDKAIVYLKSMRIEAEDLGLNYYPGDKSVIFP